MVSHGGGGGGVRVAGGEDAFASATTTKQQQRNTGRNKKVTVYIDVRCRYVFLTHVPFFFQAVRLSSPKSWKGWKSLCHLPLGISMLMAMSHSHTDLFTLLTV